ncbi:MAG TPA: DUF3052 domain-containing protein [Gemmatimonadales bacterium]|nr:DUF3052 domain-containing protein [Gemmatimonadales bacterium]
MRTSGYSGKGLVDKLGIKPGMRIAIVGAPRGFRATLGPLPDGVSVTATPRGTLPFIHFFAKQRSVLERRLHSLKRALAQDGALWVSWPKKSSGVETDLTEDGVRAVALDGGLVDVKVCAVDEVWSGLKLVRRLKDRR